MVEMNKVTSGYVVHWQASVTGAGKAIPPCVAVARMSFYFGLVRYWQLGKKGPTGGARQAHFWDKPAATTRMNAHRPNRLHDACSVDAGHHFWWGAPPMKGAPRIFHPDPTAHGHLTGAAV